jgi:hypothetical protein
VSIKYDLPINDEYGRGSEQDLAHHIFKELHHTTNTTSSSHNHTTNQCGRLILICWQHSEIPKLAHMLGCGPLQGCPLDWGGFMEFDQAWQIKFVYDVASHGLPDEHIVQRRPKAGLNGKVQLTNGGEEDLRVKRWKVFGNVVQEHFDPLAFSTQHGDYSSGGASGGDSGGRWISKTVLDTETAIMKQEVASHEKND